jgi:heme exporter protein D
MADVLAMGGYAGYVWSAYGVAAVVLIGVLVATRHSLQARTRELALLQGVRDSLRRKRDVSPLDTHHDS